MTSLNDIRRGLKSRIQTYIMDILAISRLITEDIKINNGLIPEKEENQEESEEVYNSYSGYLPASDNFKIISDEKRAKQISEWYKKAISRTSSYIHPDLSGHIMYNSIIWQPPHLNSVLIGQLHDDVFIASHYAPDPNKPLEGASLIRKAAKSSDPIIMAVPDMQSNLLNRAGFHKISDTEQPFGDKMITKNVMVNNAILDNDKYLDSVGEYLGVEISGATKCDICGKTSMSNLCKKCKESYLTKPELRQSMKLPNLEGFSLKLNQILEDYVRYVHRDSKGLMNNNSLDRMKLSDEEEFELIDLLDFGLQQPPGIRGLGSLPHGAIFAFTEEGEMEHKRLIELLTKASISGVKKIVLDPAEYKVIWRSSDGQVALIPKDKYMEGFSLKSCLLNTFNDS